MDDAPEIVTPADPNRAQSPAPADPAERSGSGRLTDSQLLREVVDRDLGTLFLRGKLRSR